jgi:hypothetical protein
VRLHPDEKVIRICTNGGYMDSNMMVGHFVEIDEWYNPKSTANIYL